MKRSPDLQLSRSSLILANFESSTWLGFIEIQIGFINSLLGPILIRAPNQFACKGIEALHFISLLVRSTFLSMSQSSTTINLVKPFNPAFTDIKLEIKRVQKK